MDIPEVKAGSWRFRQLFVDGGRRPRTRLPKEGEYRIESLPGYTGDFLRSPTRRFVYAAGDIVPGWRNLRDVEVVGITKWLDNRLPIEGVDAKSRTVTFDRPSLFALLSGDKPGPYWVENVVEALDTPGQWYLDRPQGILYYLPRPGEEMRSAEIIAPRLSQVIRVVGRAGAPVHDLRFEGLTFAHTEWQPPADYASSLQAGIEVPGACCSTTPSDASSPAAASSTSAITASRWAWAARTSRSAATGSPISARGRSASATSSPGRRTARAD